MNYFLFNINNILMEDLIRINANFDNEVMLKLKASTYLSDEFNHG